MQGVRFTPTQVIFDHVLTLDEIGQIKNAFKEVDAEYAGWSEDSVSIRLHNVIHEVVGEVERYPNGLPTEPLIASLLSKVKLVYKKILINPFYNSKYPHTRPPLQNPLLVGGITWEAESSEHNLEDYVLNQLVLDSDEFEPFAQDDFRAFYTNPNRLAEVPNPYQAFQAGEEPVIEVKIHEFAKATLKLFKQFFPSARPEGDAGPAAVMAIGISREEAEKKLDSYRRMIPGILLEDELAFLEEVVVKEMNDNMASIKKEAAEQSQRAREAEQRADAKVKQNNIQINADIEELKKDCGLEIAAANARADRSDEKVALAEKNTKAALEVLKLNNSRIDSQDQTIASLNQRCNALQNSGGGGGSCAIL